MRYNTFDNKSTNTNTRTKHSNNCNTHNQPLITKKSRRESINYYSTPVVSAPLITAFGLPTLIECEVSPSTSTTTYTKDGAPLSPSFTPLCKTQRSKSLPVSPTSDTTTKTKEYQYQRLRSKSYFESNNTNTLYTYRARSTNSKNKLTITMSKEAAYFNELSFHDDENDVSDSDTGLLMTSLPDPPPSDDDKVAASQSPLDTNGHQNGKISTEMLDPTQTKTTPTLKLWPLAVLVFYNVSGGPFGIEPSIRAGGNFFAILGFIIFPLIWSVPEALVTAELGSAFQDPAAGVAWVE